MAEFTNPNRPADGHSWLVLAFLFLVVLVSLHVVKTFRSQPRPAAHPVVRSESVIAEPFLLALRWIHTRVVANWGWAIVLLTLAINLALTPTRLMAMRSQARVQRIQPEVDAIRARYKGIKLGDPRQMEMNHEITALQRREGVNMFAGLVPLLVQMPLLYSFYRMLHGAAELQHAPWLWLHDLSTPDPWHVLPLLFVLTMFLLQRIAPTAGGDPMQRRILAGILPLSGLFMTWNAAAGLALYWTCGNIVTIAQEAVVKLARG